MLRRSSKLIWKVSNLTWKWCESASLANLWCRDLQVDWKGKVSDRFLPFEDKWPVEVSGQWSFQLIISWYRCISSLAISNAEDSKWEGVVIIMWRFLGQLYNRSSRSWTESERIRRPPGFKRRTTKGHLFGQFFQWLLYEFWNTHSYKLRIFSGRCK